MTVKKSAKLWGVTMSKVEIQCKCCPNKKMVRQADIDRGWGLFCSKSCAAYWKTFGCRKDTPTDLSLNGKRPKSAQAILSDLRKESVRLSAGLTEEQMDKLNKAGCGYIRFDGMDYPLFSSRQLRVLGASKAEIREAERDEAEEGAYGHHDFQ